MLKRGNSAAVLLSAVSAVQGLLPAVQAFAQSPGTLVGGYDNSIACGAGFACALTVQNTTYLTGTSVGGLQTVALFRTAQNPSGFVTGAIAGSLGGATGAMTLYLFDQKPTLSTCNDLVAFQLNTADVSKLMMAAITITPVVAQSATASVGQGSVPSPPPSVHNHDMPATVNAYSCLVANATIVPATTTDLFQKISVSQD